MNNDFHSLVRAALVSLFCTAILQYSTGQPLYLPDADDELEQKIITWLNDFNVTYSLFSGTLIGT